MTTTMTRILRYGKGYSGKSPVPKTPYVLHVLKLKEGSYEPLERLPLTDELCLRVAKLNGYLKQGEVYHALLNGHRIHTSFNYYVLE